jgi:hypothetical protein
MIMMKRKAGTEIEVIMEGGTGEDTMILIGVGSVTVIAATSSMQLLISEQYCHHWVLRL